MPKKAKKSSGSTQGKEIDPDATEIDSEKTASEELSSRLKFKSAKVSP